MINSFFDAFLVFLIFYKNYFEVENWFHIHEKKEKDPNIFDLLTDTI